MDHMEAVEKMVAERYVLDELPPDLRDEFEEHLFDCSECTLDVTSEAAFLKETRVQLPGILKKRAEAPNAETSRGIDRSAARDSVQKRDWLGWLRPVLSPLVAGPSFAALLAVLGYQNLVTLPGLEMASSEPRVVTPALLRSETRGAATTVEADHKGGALLAVELPALSGYTSYVLELRDSGGKTVWSSTPTAVPGNEGGAVSIMIPSRRLEAGAHSLAVVGISGGGERKELELDAFEIHFKD